MSREIKFRHIKPDGSVEFEQLNREMSGGYIEQYTGLKDKNGKEIYEGDIVKIWSDEISELALGGSQYHLEHYPYTRKVKMDSRGVYIEYPGYMLLRQFADLEVIGNIHENPELLGGEE